jgi:hypothetical protein
MTTTFEVDCPRGDCDGMIGFVEETSESYTAHGLSCWTTAYLVMDGTDCSEGHQFSDDEVKQLEKDATEAWQEGVITID